MTLLFKRLTLVLLSLGLTGAGYSVYRLDLLWKPDPYLDRLIEEGQQRSKVMHYLQGVTQIGPRLTGSPELTKAEAWAANEFRKLGLTVRLEQWGEMPFSWTRGTPQRGKCLSPEIFDFPLTTPAWMPGTEGPQRAQLVLAPSSVADIDKSGAYLRGKWVLVTTSPEQEEVTDALNKSGIKGRITGEPGQPLRTVGRFARAALSNRSLPPRFMVRRSEFKRFEKLLRSGKRVELEFSVKNVWIKEPTKLHNIVAEIPGTEFPGEVVIFGAHLDSWNSPGSTGALDNGVGVAVTLEAARILASQSQRPKRTIRFVLWTGEEQGLLGSAAYVKNHYLKLNNIVAYFNDDGGTGYHGGYVIRPSAERDFRRALEPIKKAFPDKPIRLEISDEPQTWGSSDHLSFHAAGVPAFMTLEAGNNPYTDAHHSDLDRLDLADEDNLIQSAADWACTAWYFANSRSRIEAGS